MYNYCGRYNLPFLLPLQHYSDPPTPWSADIHPVTVNTFVQPVGPSAILPPTILGIFQLFFSTALTATIVDQTNIYARQVLGENAEDQWTDVLADNIWAFLGFSILMGINRLSSLCHYWSRDPTYRYHPIADRIPRDHFYAILRFLHFTDNSALSLVPGNGSLIGTRQWRPLICTWQWRPLIKSHP